MRFIDLFCGIGGFRLVLEQQGLQCVFSSDIDEKARDVYAANFGDTPAGDILEIESDSIPSHDILCGGFPCQSFSVSGSRDGFDDTRGQLFYEILRIAKHHKPKILLLENVKGLLSIDKGTAIQRITQLLDDAGYNVWWDCLNSSFFGVPQKRERVYFICLRKDANVGYGLVRPTFKKIYLKDVLLSNEQAENRIIKRDDITWRKGILNIPALKPIQLGVVGPGCQGYRIYSTNGHAVTQTTISGGGAGRSTGLYYVDGVVRGLSVAEVKAVMGYPATHITSTTRQGYQQLGNSVVPAVVEALYKSIKFQ